MKELISIAVVVTTLFGGTITAEKIYFEVRQAALAKASEGLPRLAPFSKSLTTRSKSLNNGKPSQKSQ